MSDFVLDASTALALYLPNTQEQEDYATKVFSLIENGAIPAVPDIWIAEIASVLIKAKRAGLISKATLDSATSFLDSFAIDIHHVEYSIANIIGFAGKYGLSGYDAVYFALAKKLEIPLASLDKGHRSAAKAHGVTLV